MPPDYYEEKMALNHNVKNLGKRGIV